MFEETTTISENNVEVAEPQEVESTSVSDVDNTSVEVAKPQQTSEENARFAEIRRRKEYDDLKTRYADKEKSYDELESTSNAFKDRVKSVLGNYFEAESLEDMLIMAEAQAKGVEVGALKAQMEQTAKEQEERNSLLEQLAYYQDLEQKTLAKQGEEMAKADLEALKKLDPTIKTLDQLGEKFVELRFTKNPLTDEYYSVEEVYNHLKAKIKPLPTTSPAVNEKMVEETTNKYERMSSQDFNKAFEELVYGR